MEPKSVARARKRRRWWLRRWVQTRIQRGIYGALLAAGPISFDDAGRVKPSATLHGAIPSDTWRRP